MRLKKGTKVEVMNKEEGSVGAWYPAEIISGNGRKYYVKYNMKSEVKVERVPRDAIRPRPPPVQGTGDWVSGDLAELYHNQSWKAAVIVNTKGRNKYTVRLLGYAEELNCHKPQLRVRQIWEDDTWFVLGKGTQSCSLQRKRLAGAREELVGKNSCFSGEGNNEFPIPYVLSKESMKRKSPFGSSCVEAHHIGPQKRRVIEKDIGDLQIRSANPYLSLGKLDSSVKSLGEYKLHSPSRNGRTGFIKVDDGGSSNSFHLRTSTTLDADSCTSSVGSCSANNYELPCIFINHRRTNNADESSDAESSCGKEFKEKVKPQHETEKSSLGRLHASEWHVYSRAVQELFASGPFSWEDETTMSNLRQKLHISDDEHLMLMMAPKQILWPWSEVYCLFSKASRLWRWIVQLVHLFR